MSTPRVVFILSANYSGSHLLAQLLAAHSRCAGVGELHNYRKFRARGSRSGNVVDDYGQHPAFADLDTLPVGRWHHTILDRLRGAQPELSHLIDNSKRPSWARQFSGVSTYSLHLIRDPRALVGRWLRTYETEAARRRQRLRVLRRHPWAFGATADPVGVYVEKWLLANQAISRFLRRRPRTVLLTYRDLVLDTAGTLRWLMPRLDLAFEPAQLDYGAAGLFLGTRKRDYQAAAQRSEIRIDLRWQTELTDTQQARIVRHRGVVRYLAALGLRLTPQGLTRCGEG